MGTALLLVGYGAIGRELAPFARAFGMRVLAILRSIAEGKPLHAVDVEEGY